MPILFYLFIYFVGFLHRRSSAFIGWSSTHVLFLDHRGTFCAGGLPNVIFVAATPGTQTPMGAMQTSSANALTTSATLTPQFILKTPCCRVNFFFFFSPGFSTGLVRHYIAGLPLRSCRTIGAPSVQGSAQCVFFSFLVAAGFEPMSLSLGSGHLNHYPILTPRLKKVTCAMSN